MSLEEERRRPAAPGGAAGLDHLDSAPVEHRSTCWETHLPVPAGGRGFIRNDGPRFPAAPLPLRRSLLVRTEVMPRQADATPHTLASPFEDLVAHMRRLCGVGAYADGSLPQFYSPPTPCQCLNSAVSGGSRSCRGGFAARLNASSRRCFRPPAMPGQAVAEPQRSPPMKTEAVRILEALHIAHRFRATTLSAEEAAEALRVPLDAIVKTIVVEGDPTGVMRVCLPGARRLSLKRVAQVSGNKRVILVPAGSPPPHGVSAGRRLPPGRSGAASRVLRRCRAEPPGDLRERRPARPPDPPRAGGAGTGGPRGGRRLE